MGYGRAVRSRTASAHIAGLVDGMQRIGEAAQVIGVGGLGAAGRHALDHQAAALLQGLHQLLVGCRISRSEEHTSELQSLMRISYAVFFLKTQSMTQHKYIIILSR